MSTCILFKLRKEYGPRITAKFPPRKLLSLTPVQVEERRAHLEKYLQGICQDPGIASSSIFVSFFLNAQKVCVITIIIALSLNLLVLFTLSMCKENVKITKLFKPP